MPVHQRSHEFWLSFSCEDLEADRCDTGIQDSLKKGVRNMKEGEVRVSVHFNKDSESYEALKLKNDKKRLRQREIVGRPHYENSLTH